ncbi:MAG TPA: protein translocase subunit SecD [bacterium]|nr:protein translocase subunit SecD [bacterium]
MHGKTLFKTLLIFGLIAWSLYALWPTVQLMTMAPETREQLENEGKLVPLLNRAIALGLDLQGGMYLTLEVDLPRLLDQLARYRDSQLEEILEETREEMNVSTEGFLDLLSRNFQKRNISLNTYWGDPGDSERKVMNYLQDESREAVDRSLRILSNRVDQFGVSEPSIQKVGGRRILVQLPGVSDPDRAKELIGRTALLEFKLLKESDVFSSTLEKIDKALTMERQGKAFDEIVSTTDEETEEKDDEAEQKESQDKVVSVSELFGEAEQYAEQAQINDTDTGLVVDERMFQENPFFALLRDMRRYGHEVSVPVENVVAVNRILEMPSVKKVIPADAELLWASEPFTVADRSYRELFLVKKDVELTGTYLTDARVTIGSDAQTAGQPEVHFTLNRSGARIFSRVSGANIDKRLGIILDNRVVSAPRIQVRIPDGRSRITGIRDMEEARMLSIVLKAGALPAPVDFIEERTVGPSLGKDSITRGTWSAIIGLTIVIIFMVIYYRLSGIVADIALLLNLIILMAVLAQFQFTLTLPGIAGIVLTIGMAVDANVLVFERIREELSTGKTVRASIDAGYSRAFRTILDANVTTLLTALVLYQFGTGPIRGFAVTLSIGILVSMFTALVVTRYIFGQITSRRTLKRLSI